MCTPIVSALHRLTVNSDQIKIDSLKGSNIFLGIGLWSKRDGLTCGLPVDIMQLLLAARCMQVQIGEEKSKVIILIADSLAIREGACPEQVENIAKIYKRSINALTKTLGNSFEILLSSEIEEKNEFIDTLEEIENKPDVKALKVQDPDHCNYVRDECAHTLYLHRYHQAGIKLGWRINDRSGLAHWDEQRFDQWIQKICKDECRVSFLYAHAGLKQVKVENHVQISQTPPYTAFESDSRYVMQMHTPTKIQAICPIKRRVSNYWKGIAELCNDLILAGIASKNLVPDRCIIRNNQKATISNLLNHWINLPINSKIRFFALGSISDETFNIHTGLTRKTVCK